MSIVPRRRIPALISDIYGSFALLAGMQLDLFTPLAAGPMSAETLAARIGADASRLRRLLRVLAAFDVVVREADGRYRNGSEADACLVRGRPDSLGEAHEAFSASWQACLATAQSVRLGKPAAALEFAAGDRQAIVAMLRGLAPQAARSAQELLRLRDFSHCRTMLDIAGGAGALAASLCRALPRLTAQVVELPHIAPATRQWLDDRRAEGAGEIDRIAVHVADALQDDLPAAQDLAVMRFFIQILPACAIEAALRRAWRALRPGGTLAAIGYVLDDDDTGPAMALGADLLFLNYYQDGAAYPESGYRHWLTQAGFIHIERHALRGGVSAMLANKP